MPIYEYRCFQCGSQITVLHKTMESAQKTRVICEVCGHRRMRRVMSTFSFRGRAASPTGEAPATNEDSPQMLAQTMRQSAGGRNMGDEFNEVAARLEKGERAGAIETSLRKRKRQRVAPH